MLTLSYVGHITKVPEVNTSRKEEKQMALTGEAKEIYQREYMRRRRQRLAGGSNTGLTQNGGDQGLGRIENRPSK